MTSLLTSLTKTNAGAGQMPFLQTFDPRLAGWANALVTADTLYAVRIQRLSAPVLISNFKINLNATAGNVDIALCALNVSDGSLTRLCSTGAVSPGGTGNRTLAATTPTWAPAGVDLVLSLVATDGATITIARFTTPSAVASLLSFQLQSKASVSAPIPATVSGLTTSTTTPYIWAG